MSPSRSQFEHEFSRWLGVKHSFAFWKGRVGLYAILRAFGVGPGDEVILPGYTCIAVARPIKYLGARIVYVDIDPATYNLDVTKVAAAITSKTRVIIAQHTYGIPADLDSLLALSTKHGVELIEDACLAVGSRYNGRLVGTAARAAYWSMQWNKTFTTGAGGMVTTNDPGFASRLERLILDEALPPKWGESLLLATLRQAYRFVATPKTMGRAQALYRSLSDMGWVTVNPPGSAQIKFAPEFFKTMGSRQAKAGLTHLRQLDANFAHRRKLSSFYDNLLAERGWPVVRLPTGVDPVLVRYPVRVRDKASVVRLARERRLEIGTWFDSPLHQCTESLEAYDYSWGTCPIAEQAAREVVNLPTHRRVSEADARAAVDLICEIGAALPETASNNSLAATPSLG